MSEKPIFRHREYTPSSFFRREGRQSTRKWSGRSWSVTIQEPTSPNHLTVQPPIQRLTEIKEGVPTRNGKIKWVRRSIVSAA